MRGLRYLSIILRSIPCDPKDRLQQLERSLDLAKQALTLNFKDSDSWCRPR